MRKKLVLHKETLRYLSAPQLDGAHGGSLVEPTAFTYCMLCGPATGTCGLDTKMSQCADCTI